MNRPLPAEVANPPLRLNLSRLPHRPARDAIDFGSWRWSPVERPRRAPATLARIARARKEIGPTCLIPYYGSGSGLTGRSLDRPLGAITTLDRWALIDGDRMRMLQPPELRRAMGFSPSTALPPVRRSAIKLLGNAVCPPVARAIVERLLAIE